MKTVENNVKYVRILTFNHNSYEKIQNFLQLFSLGPGFCQKNLSWGRAFRGDEKFSDTPGDQPVEEW